VVITGPQTAYYVHITCRRTHSLGYETKLAADGHSTMDSGILTAEQITAHHNKVLDSQFARVLNAADIPFP
jgi:nicotinamidase-related amidase